MKSTANFQKTATNQGECYSILSFTLTGHIDQANTLALSTFKNIRIVSVDFILTQLGQICLSRLDVLMPKHRGNGC